MCFRLYGNLKFPLTYKGEKMKVGLYFYLFTDILTKVFKKCSLSSALPNIIFVQSSEFNWLTWQPRLNLQKNVQKSFPQKP